MLAGVFITYALSSIYASLDVQDEDFIQKNRDYVTVETPGHDCGCFTEYENMAQVDYIFPVSSVASFNFKMDFYYQTEEASASPVRLTDRHGSDNLRGSDLRASSGQQPRDSGR